MLMNSNNLGGKKMVNIINGNVVDAFTIYAGAPVEYGFKLVTPIAEAIASIEEFIADSKEHAPSDTASLAMAEAQLAELLAAI